VAEKSLNFFRIWTRPFFSKKKIIFKKIFFFFQLSLNVKMLEKIWKPDTYFYNGLSSYLHTITRPNKLLRISEHGDITYSMRYFFIFHSGNQGGQIGYTSNFHPGSLSLTLARGITNPKNRKTT